MNGHVRTHSLVMNSATGSVLEITAKSPR